VPASHGASRTSASVFISPGDIDAAVDEVERAGGKLLRRGEFSPGYPYAYVADPDNRALLCRLN
jgi:predicted enzyme related to lactoylglutathione lyase